MKASGFVFAALRDRFRIDAHKPLNKPKSSHIDPMMVAIKYSILKAPFAPLTLLKNVGSDFAPPAGSSCSVDDVDNGLGLF